MPQSLTQVYVHIVFSTKYRYHAITPEIEPELFAYIGDNIKRMNGIPILINGDSDHIHILSTLPKTVSLSKFIEDIKRNSSRWIKTKGSEYVQFYWQVGYGAFSVSPSKKDSVLNYIARQKIHHRKQTYQDELLAFLKKYQMEYDVRYLWD
jgi:putative transposase